MLESLKQSITAEAESDKIANLEALHHDRDHAFSQMEHMECRIRSAASESRKREYQNDYKHHKAEWIESWKKKLQRKGTLPSIR
jgi:hypothetical protein